MIAPWYAMTYNKLDRIAMRYGYCLALHGSMGRDFDLVAVPWVDDAESPEKLLKAFCRYIGGETVKLTPSSATKKPHGRKAYVIYCGHDGQYFDISVMPRKAMRKKQK